MKGCITFRSSIIEESGAKFDGIQKVNGNDQFVLATDKQTHSTYYIPLEGLSKKKVRTLLAEKKAINQKD